VLFFPLALVSNAIVPTGGMPSWLQAFANWSPVSTTTAALRDLFGNAKTSAVGDWPTRHPVGATVVWALILLSVCTPLAAVMYRKPLTARCVRPTRRHRRGLAGRNGGHQSTNSVIGDFAGAESSHVAGRPSVNRRFGKRSRSASMPTAISVLANTAAMQL